MDKPRANFRGNPVLNNCDIIVTIQPFFGTGNIFSLTLKQQIFLKLQSDFALNDQAGFWQETVANVPKQVLLRVVISLNGKSNPGRKWDLAAQSSGLLNQV